MKIILNHLFKKMTPPQKYNFVIMSF